MNPTGIQARPTPIHHHGPQIFSNLRPVSLFHNKARHHGAPFILSYT